MRGLERLIKLLILFGAFGLSTYFALQFGSGGLWNGIDAAHAVGRTRAGDLKGPYDLTKLEAVTKTIQTIRDKYVDPSRVNAREMLLSALNFVQRDVAQVIVLKDDTSSEVTVRVGAAEKKFRVDDVKGPWDVSAHLREVFAFLQEHLKNSPEVDLRQVEYAACNGMLNTLDPHSVFLSPEAFREMTISTQGAFGGVGIVISIRDQVLTVIKPMRGTPAGRAGIKRHDRIMRINNESTLNMPLDDAVRRLRGEPGSPVTVWLRRDGPGGWQGLRPFELKREVINVESVESRMLEAGVGYVRIKQFQAPTATELDAALASLHSQSDNKLKGLVLDLRGNPGGLLDQAAKVADRFVREGTIVSTVSASEPRDEKVAKAAGTQPDYPLVVLVNSSSASASEIVAGALKNLDRAVVVGQRTFGKGSVQLIFPDITREKAALKLTIAQYLTPGGISIQGVGITPDIELDPMTVDPLEMDVTVQGKGIREGDLAKRLSNTRAREGQKPLEVLHYNLPMSARDAWRERGGDPDDEFEMDFPIRFGKDLAANMRAGVPRAAAVQATKELIQNMQREEMGKVAVDLQKLGYDWADAPAGAPSPNPADFEVKVETDRPNNEAQAGGTMLLRATVKNNGKDPVYQLRALTKSDNPYFDRKELIFGKIEPGKSKTATAPMGWCDYEGRKIGSTAAIPKNAKRVCTLPKDAPTRADGITVQFAGANDKTPPAQELRTVIKELPRPTFAYTYQVLDQGDGSNGDGRLQKGEQIRMYLNVRNIGRGASFETQANIRNLSGEGLSLQAGRFDISNMQPGESRSVIFTFQVSDLLREPEVKMELVVGDRDLGEFVSEKISLPIESHQPFADSRADVKASGQGTELLESLRLGARTFARVPAGTAMRKIGQSTDLIKIDMGDGRFAFARANQVESSSAKAGPTLSHDMVYTHAPPMVELKATDLVSRNGTAHVTATISDPLRVLDGYMFVGARKVFYRSNQNAQDPTNMKIDVDVVLRPGMNVITFIARQNADTTSRKIAIVRRDGPNGELLETPKDGDNDLAESIWQTGGPAD